MPDRKKVIKESEEAIDILAKAEEPTFLLDFVRCAFENALALLKEQQPKTARWEKRTGMMPPEYHGHYWCSNCEWHGKYNEREKDYKFCPACGAEMENPTST